jgi:hypothetical protein
MRLKIEIDLAGKLKDHLQSQLTEAGGLYDTASEYIRDLIRADLQRHQGNKLQLLLEHLKSHHVTIQAEEEFEDLQEMLATADGT